ncbi:helix-turn-helix domain-containing protein [Streptomyces sp. NPDC048179]|uniref:helix-turn-helix domain-containing protein n=1 Tax=Streptomyces sp. NPDC048179 TaxID=3365506 RepID=UPI0037145607
MTTPAAQGLSRTELLALPATTDVETAGRAFGLGRTTAYALARSGEFPCAIVRAGRGYRVVTADLLRVLRLTPDNGDAAADAGPRAAA